MSNGTGRRAAMADQIRRAGLYIARHAEDFLPAAGSDEETAFDGLDVTAHFGGVDEVPTVTVRREAFVPTWEAGE